MTTCYDDTTSCFVVTRWEWSVVWIGTFRTLPEAARAACDHPASFVLVLEIDSATMETRKVARDEQRRAIGELI